MTYRGISKPLIIALACLAGCGPTQSIRDAIRNASVSDVRKHIRSGYDVNAAAGPFDFAALHDVASNYARLDTLEQKHLDIIDLVLSAGADVNSRDKEHRTPLHVAVWSGGGRVAEILLEHGADVNVTDRSGDTPLHMAAKKLNAEACKLLLQHGADPNARERHGDTPLHVAALEGSNADFTQAIATMDVLLDNGADMNAPNNRGTPPIRCTRRGSPLEHHLRSRGAAG
jgi:ankyrin repeat protein